MQITINQAEIEQAISQFVLGQMTINEDMELKIELRATRGDSGYTADIIITQRPEPVEAPLDIAGKVKAARQPKAAKPVETPPPAATVVEEAPVAEAQDPADEPVTLVDEPAIEVEDRADAAEEEAPASTGSIFANLRKPVNTTPAE